MQFFELLAILEKHYRVMEMKHAYRINGTVDLYKYSQNIFVIPEVTHYKKNPLESLEFIKEKLQEHNGRPDFKKTEAGNMSYQEFKNNMKSARYDYNAGDYQWKQNFDIKSDDDLYFLLFEEKVKIGRSKDVRKRIKALQTGIGGSGFCYVIKQKGFLERNLHIAFKGKRIAREWFEYDDLIRGFVQRIFTKENGYMVRL